MRTCELPMITSRRDFGHRLLSAEEERALAARVHGDDPEDAERAVHDLVAANLRLATDFVAGRRRKPGLDRDDLYQECVLGLIEAARRFDPAKGCRFSTYAWWWMRSMASKAERGRFAVHVAHWVYECATWDGERLRGLTAEQRRCLDQARRAIFQPIFRTGAEAEDGTTVAIESREPEVGRGIDGREHWALLDRLPRLEADVLRLRLVEDATLDAVGEAIGRTREGVRQIELRALRRLRRMVVKGGLAC